MFKVVNVLSYSLKPQTFHSYRVQNVEFVRNQSQATKVTTPVFWQTKQGRKNLNPNNQGPLHDLPDFHFAGECIHN